MYRCYRWPIKHAPFDGDAVIFGIRAHNFRGAFFFYFADWFSGHVTGSMLRNSKGVLLPSSGFEVGPAIANGVIGQLVSYPICGTSSIMIAFAGM
eukprot:3935478-Rhodomonas_salina.2